MIAVPTISEYIARMRAGDRRAVARLITLAENDISAARAICAQIFPFTGHAYIVGVTGAPGAGKSSLTNCLLAHLVERDFRVGVIAVDPTSPFSGGALLGDRIRMKDNFTRDKVFIRSMANRGELGGIARATKDVISILDAYGCDFVIVETVGVGQSEIEVYNTAYTTLVLTVPGMGDEIQTFKAGLMEITDLFVVNKRDHEGADRLVAEIESMLDLNEKILVDEDRHRTRARRVSEWRPPVVKTNAISGEGIPELWAAIERHRQYLESSGALREKLTTRYRHVIIDILQERFALHLDRALNPQKNPRIEKLLEDVLAKNRNPYDITDDLARVLARTVLSDEPTPGAGNGT